MRAELETVIQGATRNPERLSNRQGLFAEIAHNIDTLWLTSKNQGTEDNFLSLIQNQLPLIERELPLPLKSKGETFYGRQQPSVPEAIKETVKRLRFTRNLVSDLPDTVQGVIVGGSLSYGRFYNVRGQPNPSDVDVFVLVDKDFFDKKDGNLLISGKNGFSQQAVDDYSRRASAFQQLFLDGNADLMSIKTQVDDFLASIKIMPFEAFENEFDTQLENAVNTINDQEVIGIKDYKQGAYPNRIFTQYNFLHETFYFEIEEEYPKTSGSITTIPLLRVHNGRLYTGQHHNHVIPKMEIEFDRKGKTTDVLSKFRQHLKSRYRKEHEAFASNDKMSFSNCHDRRDILSSFIMKEAEEIQ